MSADSTAVCTDRTQVAQLCCVYLSPHCVADLSDSRLIARALALQLLSLVRVALYARVVSTSTSCTCSAFALQASHWRLASTFNLQPVACQRRLLQRSRSLARQLAGCRRCDPKPTQVQSFPVETRPVESSQAKPTKPSHAALAGLAAGCRHENQHSKRPPGLTRVSHSTSSSTFSKVS